jgi:hypothetical protein
VRPAVEPDILTQQNAITVSQKPPGASKYANTTVEYTELSVKCPSTVVAGSRCVLQTRALKRSSQQPHNTSLQPRYRSDATLSCRISHSHISQQGLENTSEFDSHSFS